MSTHWSLCQVLMSLPRCPGENPSWQDHQAGECFSLLATTQEFLLPVAPVSVVNSACPHLQEVADCQHVPLAGRSVDLPELLVSGMVLELGLEEPLCHLGLPRENLPMLQPKGCLQPQILLPDGLTTRTAHQSNHSPKSLSGRGASHGAES